MVVPLQALRVRADGTKPDPKTLHFVPPVADYQALTDVRLLHYSGTKAGSLHLSLPQLLQVAG